METAKRIELIKNLLDDLTEEERMLVFDSFCTECGSDDPKCQCWNDD